MLLKHCLAIVSRNSSSALSGIVIACSSLTKLSIRTKALIQYVGKKYVLSIFSEGNHPDKFKKMICDYCEKNKWSKSDNDLSYIIDISTSDDVIVDFITSLLKKMKEYREKDTKE